MMSEAQAVISIISGVGAVAIAWILVRVNYRKLDSGATKDLVDAAKILIDPLTERISDLEARVEKQAADLEFEKRRNYVLEGWAKALATQIIEEFGGVPIDYEPFKTRHFPREDRTL